MNAPRREALPRPGRSRATKRPRERSFHAGDNRRKQCPPKPDRREGFQFRRSRIRKNSEILQIRPHRRPREHRAGPRREPGLCLEIGRHALMPFQVILRKIGPNHRIRAKMPERFSLEGADFADRDRIHRAAVGFRHQPRERMPDVAGGAGRAAAFPQGVRQEFRQGRLPVRARDRDDPAAPEKGREIDLAQTQRAARPRRGEPGMVRHKAWREDNQPVQPRLAGPKFPTGGLPCSVLVVDSRGGSKLANKLRRRAAARSAAEHGDGPGQKRL